MTDGVPVKIKNEIYFNHGPLPITPFDEYANPSRS